MKNKMLKKAKRKLKKGMAKRNLLVEMADDMMDIIKNAKIYKKMRKHR